MQRPPRIRTWHAEATRRWRRLRGAKGSRACRSLAALLSLAAPAPISSRQLHAATRATQSSYTRFSLPKKRGGVRLIHAPRKDLKYIQRALLDLLSWLFRPHRAAHGFARHRSIVSNAAVHLAPRWLLVVDIQDFFPSIRHQRVLRLLRGPSYRASDDVARLIADLACRGGVLPQGSPASPHLANLVCRRLDGRLARWAAERGARYTRYADDLTFSAGRAGFSPVDLQDLSDIVAAEGFTLNPEKRRLVPAGRRQLVTGVIVNGARPGVPREQVRNLRALLHNIIRHGWASQLARGLAPQLASPDAAQRYRDRALPPDEARALQEQQRRHHHLLQPLTPPVRDIPTLQRIISGKLAFIAQVKGKRSSVYRSLARLAERAFAAVPEGEEPPP